MTHTKILLLLTMLATALALPAAALPVEGIAMHGTPKHPPGFTHFPYVNPDAPKGGRLVLGTLGTFDSLTPFIIKGVSPASLRDYVYESLLTRSGDEAFSLYGLIAESIEVPDDRSQITFHLRPEARFSDGTPITPEDVLFSHALLKEKGWPYHRAHYGKVARAEKIAEHTVRFTFEADGDREIPMIIGLMPILPRHRIAPETFEQTTLEPPIGSGPDGVQQLTIIPHTTSETGSSPIQVVVAPDGTYSATVKSGLYTVQILVAADRYYFTTPNVGDDATDSDIIQFQGDGVTTAGSSDMISVSEGSDAVVDAGLFDRMPA